LTTPVVLLALSHRRSVYNPRHAGVEFIDENGGGPGVRLRKASETKPKRK
jgi:hypothetical protein